VQIAKRMSVGHADKGQKKLVPERRGKGQTGGLVSGCLLRDEGELRIWRLVSVPVVVDHERETT